MRRVRGLLFQCLLDDPGSLPATDRGNRTLVGRRLYDTVTTISYRWNGQKLTGISRLLDALGVDRGSLRSPKALVNGLMKALESEPLKGS